MTRLALAALALAASACASSTGPSTPPAQHAQFTRGPVMFDVQDFPASLGVLWALPSVTPTQSAVVVRAIQYGSLCALAVDGGATVSAGHIALDVTFTPRAGADCPSISNGEGRALQYTATIAAPSGTYEVTVVHHNGVTSDTLVDRRVTVP